MARRHNRSHPLGALLDAPTDEADVPRLVRRRRITWVLLAVFVVVVVVSMMLFMSGTENDGIALMSGLGLIGVIICLLVVIQYTVRIWRLRRKHRAETRSLLAPAADGSSTPSVTTAPLQRLQAAHALLVPALPAIEPREPGIGGLAERSRESLRRTATRIVLLERIQGPTVRPTNGSDGPDQNAADELRQLTDRFTHGVSQYVELAAQAAVTADGLQSAGNTEAQIQDAGQRLAGLAQGLREVEQINQPGSTASS